MELACFGLQQLQLLSLNAHLMRSATVCFADDTLSTYFVLPATCCLNVHAALVCIGVVE